MLHQFINKNCPELYEKTLEPEAQCFGYTMLKTLYFNVSFNPDFILDKSLLSPFHENKNPAYKAIKLRDKQIRFYCRGDCIKCFY